MPVFADLPVKMISPPVEFEKVIPNYAASKWCEDDREAYQPIGMPASGLRSGI